MPKVPLIMIGLTKREIVDQAYSSLAVSSRPHSQTSITFSSPSAKKSATGVESTNMAADNAEYGDTDYVPSLDDKDVAIEPDSHLISPPPVDDQPPHGYLPIEPPDGEISLGESALPKPKRQEGQPYKANSATTSRKRKSKTRQPRDRMKFRRTNPIAKSHPETTNADQFRTCPLSRNTDETELSSEYKVLLPC